MPFFPLSACVEWRGAERVDGEVLCGELRRKKQKHFSKIREGGVLEKKWWLRRCPLIKIKTVYDAVVAGEVEAGEKEEKEEEGRILKDRYQNLVLSLACG